MVDKRQITILGATGHLGMNLVYFLGKTKKYIMKCYARDAEKTESFIKAHELQDVLGYTLEKFEEHNHEIIINCIGIGNAPVCQLFELTERFDNIVMNYLKQNRSALYINFSSGAVYGNSFETGAGSDTITQINANKLSSEYHAMIIKLNSELKHRMFPELNIVDLRLFAFFSRFIPLSSHYFMAQVVQCFQNQEMFITSKEDFVRDFIHPLDLIDAIEQIIGMSPCNFAIDLYSKEPISKMEIIELLKRECGLKVKYIENISTKNPSGDKKYYYSNNKKQKNICNPIYSSKDTILGEVKYLQKR